MATLLNADLELMVLEEEFVEGLAIASAGGVTIIRADPAGASLEATVLDGRPYHILIQVAESHEKWCDIVTNCACGLPDGCVHAAAAIAALQDAARAKAEAKAAKPHSHPMLALPQPKAKPQGADLPPAISHWLDKVSRISPADPEAFPSDVRRRLIYLFGSFGQTEDLRPRLVSIERRKDGSYSDHINEYEAYKLLHTGSPPKFLRPSDHRILQRLAFAGESSSGNLEFADTLRLMLATGRVRWKTPLGQTLREGPAIDGAITWRTTDDGGQMPAIITRSGHLTFAGTPPWYVDEANGLIGEVRVDVPMATLRTVLAAPTIPPEFVTTVRAALGAAVPELPQPAELPAPNIYRGKPELILRLFGKKVSVPNPARLSWRDAETLTAEVGVARLSFRYGPHEAGLGEAFRDTGMLNGELYRVIRNNAAEYRARKRLGEYGLKPTHMYGGYRPYRPEDHLLVQPGIDRLQWLNFVEQGIDALRAEGWKIVVADDFPLRLARLTGEITARIEDGVSDNVASGEGSGIDWFDMSLDAQIDGERVDLLPLFGRMMTRYAQEGTSLAELLGPEEGDGLTLMTLPDGRLLKLETSRIRPFLATILELFGNFTPPQAGERARLPRRAMADLARVEDASGCAGIVWQGGEALRVLGRQLRDASGIPVPCMPAPLGEILRPYQARGVAWLQFLRVAGLGGVLGDDMGLGKTLQTLAHLAIEHAEGRLMRPALVICPTSLVSNWRSEAGRFTPQLRVLALHGPDRHQDFPAIPQHDLVITTYPLLTRDHERLLPIAWHSVVLDEAQTIKNPAAAVTQLVGKLQAGQRICLSGTPMENHLGELWSLFHFLMPGFLGDRVSFGRLWRTPIEKGGDVQRQASLVRRVSPFLLRRTKGEVAADLPAKTEIVDEITMEAAQSAVYESIRVTMHAKVQKAVAEKGLARSGIIILDALLKLRQACCDPRLLKLETAKAARAKSAKLERLMEMLEELIAEGRRILLFSQFTSMLALIEEALVKAGQPYVLLTGDTKDRATPIKRFQSGEVPLFLISLKAGGTGLNLTAADTVIHYDPWWNPAVENQATDRAHRIGQDKPVFVHRLITMGTIEEKMQVLKARKQTLVDGILAEGGQALAITEADIEALFGA